MRFVGQAFGSPNADVRSTAIKVAAQVCHPACSILWACAFAYRKKRLFCRRYQKGASANVCSKIMQHQDACVPAIVATAFSMAQVRQQMLGKHHHNADTLLASAQCGGSELLAEIILGHDSKLDFPATSS